MDIESIAAMIGGGDALSSVAARLGISPDQAQAALHGVLEHTANGGAADGVVAAVAAKAGIDPSVAEQFLPSVMGLLQGHAESTGEGGQDALGGLLGSVGGLLGGAGGSGLGGLAGMASGLFGAKE